MQKRRTSLIVQVAVSWDYEGSIAQRRFSVSTILDLIFGDLMCLPSIDRVPTRETEKDK